MPIRLYNFTKSTVSIRKCFRGHVCKLNIFPMEIFCNISPVKFLETSACEFNFQGGTSDRNNYNSPTGTRRLLLWNFDIFNLLHATWILSICFDLQFYYICLQVILFNFFKLSKSIQFIKKILNIAHFTCKSFGIKKLKFVFITIF